MNRSTKSPVNNIINTPRLLPKKSLLFSSHDLNRMAEESSRARLIRQLVQPDDNDMDYEEYPSKFPHLVSPHLLASTMYGLPERNEFISTYPGTVGLRWNPCVEMSSREEIPMDWTSGKTRPRCKCRNCTSERCPSKKPSCYNRPGFKNNIMTFSDKCTMTPKVNHASCSARTPAASPRSSDLSMSGSSSQTRIHNCSHCPKPTYQKPCRQADYCYPQPCYDEAVRDTDPNEDECPAIRKRYCRRCPSKNSGSQYHANSGKINLYNEGICDTVASKYPVSTPCLHDIRNGSRMFCMNKCPDCHCRIPSTGYKESTSKYHQQCKLTEYNRPVYYDTSNENCRVRAIPSYDCHRFAPPCGRASKTQYDRGIILPKKVLTSERDIESYIGDEPCQVRGSRRKKSKQHCRNYK